MDNNHFRHWARQAADWSADYLATVDQRPVRPPVRPGDVLHQLPLEPPSGPEPMEAIFADLDAIILPGMTHWQHPRFFAYFPANSSPPSVVAETITAALAAQCMLWQTSPAATELETRVLDWLRGMIGLPDSFRSVIQDSASSATLAALLAARERALGGAGNREGLAAHPPVRVYCSAQAHSSIDKAVRVSGIGDANLVRIPVMGDRFAMDVAALDRAIQADREAGYRPAAIVACLGGTSVGACDDIAAVATVARRHDLFLHVDAAWAGSAMICPEFRDLMQGAELADSFVMNPHKWLFTNFDLSAHFVRDPKLLTDALSLKPAYLRTLGTDGQVDYSDWSVPLGRRFRALKLWFVIRAYGVAHLQQTIRTHVALAEEIAGWIDRHPDFEVVTKPILSLFTFRYAPQRATDLDTLNARLVEALNADGRIYLTQTQHQGQFVIRFQVGQTSTARKHVEQAWSVIQDMAARIEHG
jgi:aromatic-L-amino-acid decarboxylase